MLLSATASTGQLPSRTLQFSSTLGGIEVRILVDSGSSHSFLSSAIAARFQGVSPTPRPISVTVANVALCNALRNWHRQNGQEYQFVQYDSGHGLA